MMSVTITIDGRAHGLLARSASVTLRELGQRPRSASVEELFASVQAMIDDRRRRRAIGAAAPDVDARSGLAEP